MAATKARKKMDEMRGARNERLRRTVIGTSQGANDEATKQFAIFLRALVELLTRVKIGILTSHLHGQIPERSLIEQFKLGYEHSHI